MSSSPDTPQSSGTNSNKRQKTSISCGNASASYSVEELRAEVQNLRREYETNLQKAQSRRAASGRSPSNNSAGLSFGIMYPRERNDQQESEYREFKSMSRRAHDLVQKGYGAIDLASPNCKYINLTHNILSTDNNNSHIYAKANDIITKSQLDKPKIGQDGGTRYTWYKKQYAKKGLPPPHLVSLTDLDNMQPHLQRDLVSFLIQEGRSFQCRAVPDTLADVIALNLEGLPVPLQKLFYGIVTPLKDCVRLGGAIEINGNLKSLVKNVLETGMQESLHQRGYPIQQSASLHECANGISLNWFVVKMFEIWKARAKMFRSNSFTEKKRALMLEMKVEQYAESSWKPGTPKGTEDHKRATPMLLQNAVGTNWKDSQPNPPSNKSKNIFNAKLYKMADWELAINNKLGALLYASLFSGSHFIDEDKVNMQAKGGIPMVQWIESLRLFGPEGPVWKVVEDGTYLGTTVMYLDYEWENSVHILFVHGAPCNIMQSNPLINYGWGEIDGMGVTALSWQYAIESSNVLATPNATIVEEDDILSIIVSDNPLYLFSESVHNRQFNHIYAKGDALRFKQDMVAELENLYRVGANGIRRTKGDYYLFGLNARHTHSNAINPSGELFVSRDNMFRRECAHAVTATSTIDEAAAILVRASRYDIFGDGSKITAPSTRHAIIMRLDDLIDPKVLRKYDQLYKSTTKNSGNTTTQRTATSNEVEDVSVLLKPYHASGGGFFVQAAGNAGKRTKKDGTPFDLPEDGTVLGTYICNGRQKEIVFQSRDFVSIVLGTLRGRCKPPRTKGLTKRKKALRFTDSTIGWAKDMIGLDRDSVLWTHDSNVLYVWFEPK